MPSYPHHIPAPGPLGGEPTEIARSPNTDRVFHLSSGLYRVVSQYGGHNVRETADVTIKPGETQKLEFELHAGEVRLTLERKAAARRAVAWTITDASGQEVARSEEREPALTLKSGSYKAEARVGLQDVRRQFRPRRQREKDGVRQPPNSEHKRDVICTPGRT